MLPRRGLYALVDTTTLDERAIDVVRFAEAALAGKPSLLQLRAKNRSANETLALLRAIAPLAAAADVPFFANDRPDLAALAGVPGVHVGQEDLSVSEVRRAFPELLVGVSTHTVNQVDEALAADPDYLAFGPIFPTVSKQNPDPVVGLRALRDITAAARRHPRPRPVVAIGGLDLREVPRDGDRPVVSRLEAVASLGVIPAVIGAIVPPRTEGERVDHAAFFDAVAALVSRVDRLARAADQTPEPRP